MHFTTLMNWEHQSRGPLPRFMPGVIRFLGYIPFAPAGKPLPGRVRAVRRQLGLTQKQLAARVGVSIPTVSRWECGRSAPNVVARGRLAVALTPERQTSVSDDVAAQLCPWPVSACS